MKINFYSQNNKSKHQRNNISFEAGLTPAMIREIRRVDVLEISNRLAKKGIPTDFKGNEVIAWCSNKAIEIFEQLNKKCKQRNELPNGAYLDDFINLNVDDPFAIRFCNLAPTILRKNSTERVPSKTIFFNTFDSMQNLITDRNKHFYSWDAIDLDKSADINYLTGFKSTDIFLEPFLHELITHVLHIENLQVKIGGKAIVEAVESFKDPKQVEKYRQKYGEKISGICKYALENPFEAVACDMSRVIANSLDKETLMPTRNPFIGTPYENLSFWQRVNLPDYSDEERPLNEILRRFWNGKFD